MDGWAADGDTGDSHGVETGGGWGDVALIPWAPPPEAGGTSARTVVSGAWEGRKGGHWVRHGGGRRVGDGEKDAEGAHGRR